VRVECCWRFPVRPLLINRSFLFFPFALYPSLEDLWAAHEVMLYYIGTFIVL
jgi:hypothetical protein